MTVLLTATDARVDDGVAEGDVGVRTDTILVARLDPGEHRLSLLSLPRDLIVADAAGAPVLINSFAGDPAALLDAVETQIGIPVDHVVQVDVDGFRALVDRIGGIDVFFPAAVRDTGSGLYVDTLGCTRLDGEAALALARSRNLEVLMEDGSWWHDPYSDLGRVERQRVVVAAALAGLDRTGRSPGEVRDQVDWVVDHVTIDAGLSLDDLMELGRTVATLGAEDVDGATIPVTVHPADPNRLALAPEAAATVSAFVAGDPLPASTGIEPLPAVPLTPSVAPSSPFVWSC